MVGDLPPAGRRKGAGDGSGDGMTEKFRGSVSEWPRAVLDWLCGDREDYRALQRRCRQPTESAGGSAEAYGLSPAVSWLYTPNCP